MSEFHQKIFVSAQNLIQKWIPAEIMKYLLLFTRSTWPKYFRYCLRMNLKIKLKSEKRQFVANIIFERDKNEINVFAL